MVAFNSAGRGLDNEFKPFFSQELEATKAPENVDFERLSSNSINVTWTPLTLFEARGFPIYTVTLEPPQRRRKRQAITEMTTDSFYEFTNLVDGLRYTTSVAVQTGQESGTLTRASVSDSIIGNVNCQQEFIVKGCELLLLYIIIHVSYLSICFN